MYKLKSILFFALSFATFISAKANTASFTFNTVCEGNATQFTSTSVATTGTIVSEEWDFDGDSIYDLSGNQASYTFPAAGTYNVLLKITTSTGFVGYSTNAVSVDHNPTVTFTSNGSCLGEVTTFAGAASISNGTIASYQWEFNGNGDFADASGANQSFTFVAPGYFNVGLRATSNKGCATDVYNTVTIAPKPTVNFAATNVCDGSQVEFINNSVALGPSITYTWAFGDGNTSNLKEPSYTYGNPGSFSVKLIGENTAGCKDSISRNVSVFANPTASFTTQDVCFGEDVIISNTTQYNGAVASDNFWDFGDGNSGFDLNSQLVKQYDAVGTYTITLSVKTKNNCTDTTSENVTINRIPEYDIVADGPTEFCEGENVVLSVSPDSTTTAVWSTGVSGNSITVQNQGLFDVVFYTPQGCQFTTSQEVFVRSGSVLTISNDTAIENGDFVTLKVSGATTYTWQSPVSSDQSNYNEIEVSPSELTTYIVDAINEFGCSSSAQVVVDVFSNFNLMPSNLMTPDGNGQNDFWYIENIERYPECEVLIYNAYGKLIYSQKAYNNTFDGTVNGGKLPEGTYYYVITCDGKEDNFSGSLTLLRINE